MFVRSEKRRVAPWLVLTVGGLAAVGAVSLVSGGRRAIRMAKRRVREMFSGTREECECECE